MISILSTKKLSISQKEHLLKANLAVVDANFITTEAIPFTIPNTTIEQAIFSSQKGVKVVLDNNIKIKKAYCVGKRTETIIKQHNINVVYTGDNAKELGNYIITKEHIGKFSYFCALDRLDTLPNILNLHKVQWKEIPVYKTVHTPKVYKKKFDAVLFFSPSGVNSFVKVNPIPEHSFCIGETTANTLREYTSNYTIASKPSVENVLIKAIKYFKK